MDPSVMQTTTKAATKPAAWWILVTIAAGIAGSFAAIGVAGSGTYEVAPFEVELRAIPAPQGKTVFAKEAAGIEPGRAEAGTHAAPMEFKATITGVSVGDRLTSTDPQLVAEPIDMAGFLSEQGKDAIRSFGIKLAIVSVGGGALGGIGVALAGMRWRRIAGGAVAGLLTLAVVGVLTQQTYDKDEFRNTSFVADESLTDPTGNLGDVLPGQ